MVTYCTAVSKLKAPETAGKGGAAIQLAEVYPYGDPEVVRQHLAGLLPKQSGARVEGRSPQIAGNVENLKLHEMASQSAKPGLLQNIQ